MINLNLVCEVTLLSMLKRGNKRGGVSRAPVLACVIIRPTVEISANSHLICNSRDSRKLSL